LLLCKVAGVEIRDTARRCGCDGFEALKAGAATYKEACEARGLLATDREWDNTLHDAASMQMPRQMRDLFVTLLVFNQARWVTSLYKTTVVLTELPAVAIAILRGAFNSNKLVVSYSFTDTNGKGLSDSDISKCNAKIAKALKAAAEAEEEGGTDPGEDDDSDDASSTAGSTAAAARAAHTYTEEVEQVLGEQNEFLSEQFAILEDSIHKAVAREIAPAVQAIPSVTKEVKALATKLDAFGKVSTAIQKELAILQAGLGPLPSAGGSASSSSSSSSSASPSKEVPSGVAAEGGSKEAKSLTPSKRAAAASPASASRPVRNGRAAAAKPSM